MARLKYSIQKDEQSTPAKVGAPTEDRSAIQKFDDVLIAGLTMQATEIHLEPYGAQTRVRYRVGSTLSDQEPFDGRLHPTVVNRIKVLANLDIAKRGIAQKGYFRVELDDSPFEAMAIIAPSANGDKAMLKVSYRSAFGFGIEQLGMYPPTLAGLHHVLERPNGLLLVAGPPGSGRTTTCYSILRQLNSPDRLLTSVETDIRYQVPGVVQSKPEPRYGHTFQDALNAAVDQEPDVLLVGEMSDSEVARISISAAFGKRIVVGRMNAAAGATALLQLMDMGLPGFLVSSGVIGVVSQRLLRRLCDSCREPYVPQESIVRELGLTPHPELRFYRARGCPSCGNVGFNGKVACFELFVPNERVQERLVARGSAREITESAQGSFVPLKLDGLGRVAQGLTTLEELLARL
ncbi:MAG: Flp pilus assembly complex ATPase component TadA [Deltaproteobacteria bacterium]|nr:Flp pilus assembly complex ATPase component TadA [Deltaproteobacteria bacterium]